MRVWIDDEKTKNSFIAETVGGFLKAIASSNPDFANLICQDCDLGIITFGGGFYYTVFEHHLIVIPRDEATLTKLSEDWHSELKNLFPERDYAYTPEQESAWQKYYNSYGLVVGVVQEVEQSIRLEDPVAAKARLKEKIKALEPPEEDKSFTHPYKRYQAPEFGAEDIWYVDLMCIEDFLKREWHSKSVGISVTASGQVKATKIKDSETYKHQDFCFA